MNHYRYFVSDPVDPRFQATGVIEGEELVVDIRTESEFGERSAALRAPDHMRKIMAHFVHRYSLHR